MTDLNKRDLIAKLIHVMLALGLYQSDFEPLFLEKTSSFFKVESQKKIEEFDLANYLHYVENVLQSELIRV